MRKRVTAHGKQLKLDGRHLADCISEEAAAVIAIALNGGRLSPRHYPAEWIRRVERFFA